MVKNHTMDQDDAENSGWPSKRPRTDLLSCEHCGAIKQDAQCCTCAESSNTSASVNHVSTSTLSSSDTSVSESISMLSLVDDDCYISSPSPQIHGLISSDDLSYTGEVSVVQCLSTADTATCVPFLDTANMATSVPLLDTDDTTTSVLLLDTGTDTATSMPLLDTDDTTISVPFLDTDDTTTSMPLLDTDDTTTSMPLLDTDDTTTSVPLLDIDDTTISVPLLDIDDTTTSVPLLDIDDTTISVPLLDTDGTTTSVPLLDTDGTTTSVPLSDTTTVILTSVPFLDTATDTATGVPLLDAADTATCVPFLDSSDTATSVPLLKTAVHAVGVPALNSNTTKSAPVPTTVTRVLRKRSNVGIDNSQEATTRVSLLSTALTQTSAPLYTAVPSTSASQARAVIFQIPTTRVLRKRFKSGMDNNAVISSSIPLVNSTTIQASVPLNSTVAAISITPNSAVPAISVPLNSVIPRTSVPLSSAISSTSVPLNSVISSTSVPLNSVISSTSVPLLNSAVVSQISTTRVLRSRTKIGPANTAVPSTGLPLLNNAVVATTVPTHLQNTAVTSVQPLTPVVMANNVSTLNTANSSTTSQVLAPHSRVLRPRPSPASVSASSLISTSAVLLPNVTLASTSVQVATARLLRKRPSTAPVSSVVSAGTVLPPSPTKGSKSVQTSSAAKVRRTGPSPASVYIPSLISTRIVLPNPTLASTSVQVATTRLLRKRPSTASASSLVPASKLHPPSPTKGSKFAQSSSSTAAKVRRTGPSTASTSSQISTSNVSSSSQIPSTSGWSSSQIPSTSGSSSSSQMSSSPGPSGSQPAGKDCNGNGTSRNVFEIHYPGYWKVDPAKGQIYNRLDVLPSAKEFQTVVNRIHPLTFRDQLIKNYKLKVERIENVNQYQLYAVRKSAMDQANGKEVVNERWLWHGTDLKSVEAICRAGFNRSHAGRHATAVGKGVYFGAQFCTSYNFAQPNSAGKRSILLCRVLTGKYALGRYDMVEPPTLTKKSLGRYNSVVDRVNNPGMFIIFHDAQVYPEYVVSLGKK